MSLDTLKRQPAEQLAAQALTDSILTGELRPGLRLIEAVLADRFAVSRGTVRAALHQLNIEGLVVLTPYTGWSVATIERQDLWEIYTLRSSLERLAARLTTERLTGEGRRRITAARDLFFASCEGSDVKAAVEKDFALHRCIVELSGHDRVINQYRLLEQQIHLFINSTYGSEPNLRIAVDHHAPIVDAIMAGDGPNAARLSEEHVLGEGDRLLRTMPSDAR